MLGESVLVLEAAEVIMEVLREKGPVLGVLAEERRGLRSKEPASILGRFSSSLCSSSWLPVERPYVSISLPGATSCRRLGPARMTALYDCSGGGGGELD
jgi:hypothetical protein